MIVRRDLHLTSLILAGVIVILTGCVTTGKETPNNVTPVNDTINYVAEPNLTPKQRFIKALDYLEHGEQEKASIELEEYLRNVPNSSRAKSLLEQIKQETNQYFPENSFAVTLSSGESLSTLAKKYLGSPLKFYALAKYNNISNPSRVNIGQTINVPLTKEAIAVRESENQLKASAKAPVTSKPEEKLPVVATVKKEEQKVVKQTEQTIEVTEQSLVENLKAALSKPDYKQAIVQLNLLKGIGPLSELVRPLAIQTLEGQGNNLSGSNKVLASQYLSEAANLNNILGNAIAAINDYKFAVHLDPNNANAAEELGILQKDVSDQLHREASSAFRRQELDIAIEKWDKVLEINPDYTSAKLYRAQALELKARLEKIKD